MSARMILSPQRWFALFSLFLAVLFFPKGVLAFEPQRYYDWGPYYERVNPQVLGLSVAAAQAQGSPSTTPVSPDTYSRFSYFLGFTTNFAANHPLYFVKTFQESVGLALTFDPVKREEVRLAIAGRRIEELERLSDEGKSGDVLARTSQSYRNTVDDVAESLEQIKAQNANPEAILDRFEDETTKHSLILGEVALKVPEAAQAAVETALDASQGVVDRVADLTGRPPLPVEILDRLQSLKAQGLVTPEEVTAIASAKTRGEGRDLVKKFIQEGIFPAADVHQFDELAKDNYFQDFAKIFESKKLLELKRLEEERPDEEIIKRVQDFAKTYKEGEVVPSDIRRYWVPMVRLEELQNTFRPDYIDPNLFQRRVDDLKKFQEVVERVKPRPEDVMLVERLIIQNPNAALDPFYERVRRIAGKFGASCGADGRWVPLPQTGGYCAPKDFDTAAFETPRFNEDRACGNSLTSAQGPGGACVSFPNACLPPGWARVTSCAGSGSDGPSPAQVAARACPSNSHWAPVPYMPEGGYCVPNITYTTYQPPSGEAVGAGNLAESVCPAKYHRNYPGGPCVPDTYFGTAVNYPTYTPGFYPSPVYPPAGCPAGYFWSGTTCLSQSRACGYGRHYDPETGGCTSDTLPYVAKCGPNEYSGPNGVCTPNEKSSEAGKCSSAGRFWTGQECLDKAPTGGSGVACPENQVWDDKNKFCSSGGYGGIPRADMGDCRTPGECYDWCQANPGKCSGFNPNSPRPGETVGTPSREAQEAACRAGGGTCVSWVNNACGCEYRSGGNVGTGNVGACPTGQYRGPGGYCISSGGGGNVGSCPSGQYIGPGGYCISSYSGNTGYAPSRESQEAACRAGGGVCVSWVNNACGCERSGGSGNTGTGGGCPSGQYMGPGGYCISSGSGGGYVPPSGYTPPSSYTPPSGYGSCSGGQYWNGTACVSSSGGSYTPPSSDTPPSSYTPPASYTPPTSSEPSPPPSSPPPSEPAPAPTSDSGGSYSPPSSYTGSP